MSENQKKVWITGASSGIGKAVAEKFAKENWRVAISARRTEILDEIAYYNPNENMDDQSEPVQWFNLVRNLTMTGYFTSEVGIKELGYKGNFPNVWDGVPQDVLDQYGLEYDKEWLDKFVDQSKRNIIAEWDDDGNLIT